jgi:hypothetical protein
MANEEKKWYERLEFVIGLVVLVAGFFLGVYGYIITPIHNIELEIVKINGQLTLISNKLNEHINPVGISLDK